jgi:hypothetical protein
MTWFYEIRDANKRVVETGNGYITQQPAINAGRKKARKLKASDSLPGDGEANSIALIILGLVSATLGADTADFELEY